jgi:hypothetical protein
LIYEDYQNYVGLYHCWLNLSSLIKEAIYLNRIPVIMPPLLNSNHNFGINFSSNWQKYLNIPQTEVYIKENGEFKQKPFVFILEKDFKQKKFKKKQVNMISPYHEVTEEENRKYQLIVRSVSTIFYGLWSHANPKTNEMISVNPVWSDDVLKISKKIIHSLGGYSAIHVRRGDRLNINKNLKKFTSPKHILNTMKDIVPLKSKVYLLTNESDRNFFDLLRRHYRIYQYFDFDELNSIVSEEEPDNNFLFLIERCIYENAAIKIGTFKYPKAYFWVGGDYSLSKYNRWQFSTGYTLRQYLRLMRYFFKGFRRRPFSFKSRYNNFCRHNRVLFRNFIPQKS